MNHKFICSSVALVLFSRLAAAQPAAAVQPQTPPEGPSPKPDAPAPPAAEAPSEQPTPPPATPAPAPPSDAPSLAPAAKLPDAPAAPPLAPAPAEATPALRAEDLDLGALLNMNTTVATKQWSAISRSPGMVTAYGEGDIRRLGYYTLSDLADVTAGYSSYTIYGEKVFETRGQKAGSFNNNKHLVLIDGIPINHGKGNKAMIDENFPLLFADRVEFLKGPASALYGTGAFFGVVNIAPKELDASGFKAEGRATLGNEQGDKQTLVNMMYRDRDRHAAIYAGYYEKGPSRAFTGSVNNADNRMWDDQRSEFLYATYGVDSGVLTGLKVGFIYASKNGGLGEHWLGGYSPVYDDLTWIQIVPYVKYEHKLSDDLVFDAYVKADRDIEKGTAAGTSSANYDGTGQPLLLYENAISVYEGQAEMRWTPIPAVNVIGGGNVNINYQNADGSNFGGNISADPGPVFIENTKTLTGKDIFQTYSPFLQATADAPVLSGLHVTAGARVDSGKAVDASFSQISPRVGVVQELTNFLSVKALYGTALRAPGNKEIGLNNEVRANLVDPSLAAQVKPETIRSLEGGLAFNVKHVSANVAVFYNDTRDALDGRPAPGIDGAPRNIFQNAPGKTIAKGTEVELALAANADSRLFANYAYARALQYSDRSDSAGQELADVPIHKVNAGVSYRLHEPIDLTGTVVGKWVSGYRTGPPPGPDAMGVQPPPHPAIDGHFLLDANVIYRATEHTSFELAGRNLLDTKFKLPQGGVPYVPMPRRSVHATLDYRW